MSHKLAMANTRMKLVAGAVVLGMAAMASVASAQTTLVGGGATLPALGYAGSGAASTRLVTPSSTSLFGAYSATRGNAPTSYCQTGSGAGKNILAGVAGTNVQNNCDGTFAPGEATPTGFGAATVGRTTLAFPNFAASDSPLAQSDVTNYNANHTATSAQALQFPSVAGAIAIGFNKAGVSSLDLSEAQICQVFSGQVTDWSDLTGGAVSGPIHVVFRSDGSGTSFSFSNHLSAVCGPTSIGGNGIADDFKTNQTYATAAAAYLSAYASSEGASGNPGVANAIAATDGSLGYLEAANSKGAAGVTTATVGGKSPTADFGSKVSVTTVSNEAISNDVDSNGRPQLVSVSAPAASCITVVDPNSYAVNPTVGGYPIIAVSYLLGNATGNGTDAAHVRSFLGAPYNSAIQAATSTIGVNTGLAFLTVSNVTQSQINACVIN